MVRGTPIPNQSRKQEEFPAMTIYKPYTYLIGWSSLNKYYYGVRYAKNCNPNDFWKKYFTSSKYVQELRESKGEPDIIQIRKTFDCANDAIKWENTVIHKLKLHQDERFLNQAAYPAMSPEIMSKRIPWNKNKRGLYKATDEVRKKMSESQKGKLKPGTAQAMKGNQKTKNWKWYNNGENSILLPLEKDPPKGYAKGRLDTLNGKTKGQTKSNKTKRKFSMAAKERSKIRLCCINCKKELPSNSLGSHNRFCN